MNVFWGLLMAWAFLLFGCEGKEKIKTETLTVVKCIDPFSSAEIDCDNPGTQDTDDDDDTSDDSDDDNSDDDDNDDSSSSTDSDADDTALTPAVSLSGTLALSLSDSSSSGRTFATRSFSRAAEEATDDTYWLKCATVDLEDDTSCVGQVSSAGEFSFDCEFKGKEFGCFIMQGADKDDLTIKGLLKSDDLYIGSDADAASMSITFDPVTGASSASLTQAKVVNGETQAIDVSSVQRAVPSALKNLNIADGTYNFCMVDANDPDAAMRGIYNPLGSVCYGFQETMYIDFTAATSTKKPQLSVWRSKKARDNCTDGNGDLQYHISDGTNVLAFAPGDLTYSGASGLLQTVLDNNWAPQSAIDFYNNSSAQASEDPMKELMKQAYPTNTCESLVADLKTTWNSIDTSNIVTDYTNYDPTKSNKQDPMMVCMDLTYPKSNVTYSGLSFNQAVPPHWCSEWLRRPANERDGWVSQVKAECKGFVETDETLWAGQDVVRQFLDRLSEARHRSADNRFSDLETAYSDLKKALADATTGGATHDPSNGSDLTSLKGGSITAYDDHISFLSQYWGDQHYDYLMKEALWCIAEDVTDDPANCSGLGTIASGLSQSTNRELFWDLFVQVPPWDAGLGAGETWIEEEICHGSATGAQLKIATGAETAVQTFLGYVQDENGWATFSDSASDNDIKGYLDDLYDAILPKVAGCQATRISSMKSALATWSSSFEPGLPEDQVNQMFHDLKQYVSGAALGSMNMSGTLADLADDIVQLALDFPFEHGHLLYPVCDHIAPTDNYVGPGGFACGVTVPAGPLSDFLCGPSNSCNAPDAFGDAGMSDANRRDSLATFVQQMSAGDAFMSDETFQTTINKIIKNSQCIPDASLGHIPVDEGSNIGFALTVRAPTSRRLNGKVELDLSREASGNKARFLVREERLEKFEAMMGADEGCYWGERNVFNGLTYDSSNSILNGIFTKAWVDTCIDMSFGSSSTDTAATADSDASASSSDSQSVWYQTFRGKKVSE